MQGILYDATKVKVCQAFYDICNYAELPAQWSRSEERRVGKECRR